MSGLLQMNLQWWLAAAAEWQLGSERPSPPARWTSTGPNGILSSPMLFRSFKRDTGRSSQTSAQQRSRCSEREPKLFKLESLKEHYGTEEVWDVSSTGKLQPVIDAAQMDLDYASFELPMETRAKRGESTEECWSVAIQTASVRGHMPSHCQLAQIMLVLPSISVENERQFSLRKLLKGALRDGMKADMLNALCRVKRSPYGLLDFPYQLPQSVEGDGEQGSICLVVRCMSVFVCVFRK